MKNLKQYAKENFTGFVNMTLSVNPLGCSPRVLKRLQSITAANISSYPDKGKFIQSLKTAFGINEQNIVLGTGSEQLIKLICQTFLRPKDLVLIPRGSFVLFSSEPQLVASKTAFLEDAVGSNPQLIFIANPQTPTGEVVSLNKLKAIRTQFPEAILVVDEANGEFINTSFVSQIKTESKCIVLKTFSKAFGLAGIRIGFATGSPQLIRQLQKAQQPFPVSSLALILAEEALLDKTFLQKSVDFVKKEREFLTKELKKRGFTVSKSVTNNIFVSGQNMEAILKCFPKLGVSVINNTFFPGLTTSGFRISLKERRTNRLFLEKLDQVLTTLPHRHTSE